MALAGCPDSFLHLPYRIVSYETACSCQLVASYHYVPVIDCAFRLFIKLLISCLAILWVLLRFGNRASVTILYSRPAAEKNWVTNTWYLGHWLKFDTSPQSSWFISGRKYLCAAPFHTQPPQKASYSTSEMPCTKKDWFAECYVCRNKGRDFYTWLDPMFV